ncbi:kelch-like protein 10 [Centroberyx affinis]|uniref:kelch-like protein 10 n=1 Tax=Centroberyx affinis TaxID=166261 RepID=UPI003A5C2B1F
MACSVLNELRLEGKLCDVVIRVGDVEFNAHKNVLCGCSPYFRALFTGGWATSEQRVYNIPDVSANMMRLIIEYAYTHSVPVTEQNVEELLAAADRFSITGVTLACCDFLENQLCLENCIGIWKFVDLYYCPDLRGKAYRFILHHFEEIAGVSEFLDLSLQQLADIIEKDKLNVKQESAVFEAVLRWIAHSPEERSGHISMLLPKVRLALMASDYFMYNVKNNDLVEDSDECKPIIINTMRAMCDLNMNRPSRSNYSNPLARPRLPSDILLAIGGRSVGTPTNAFEAYDARADRWVTVSNDEESVRAYHGAAFLNGFVYCVGGHDSTDLSNSACKFNLVTRTWHQVAPMHSRRCCVSVAVLNGRIYAMGGCDGQAELETAERYEPETNQWTLIAPMHEYRSNACATTLHGKVYVCGGSSENRCLSTAECYDPETNQWTLIAPMRSSRSGLGVVAYGERVYAVGGFDGTRCLCSAEAYDPLTNTWCGSSPMLNPRSNFGIAVVDDQLFVVGGFNGVATMFNVERYNEKTNEWYDARDMEIFLSAHSCCVVQGLPVMEELAAPRDAPPLPGVEEADIWAEF